MPVAAQTAAGTVARTMGRDGRALALGGALAATGAAGRAAVGSRAAGSSVSRQGASLAAVSGAEGVEPGRVGRLAQPRRQPRGQSRWTLAGARKPACARSTIAGTCGSRRQLGEEEAIGLVPPPAAAWCTALRRRRRSSTAGRSLRPSLAGGARRGGRRGQLLTRRARCDRGKLQFVLLALALRWSAHFSKSASASGWRRLDRASGRRSRGAILGPSARGRLRCSQEAPAGAGQPRPPPRAAAGGRRPVSGAVSDRHPQPRPADLQPDRVL